MLKRLQASSFLLFAFFLLLNSLNSWAQYVISENHIPESVSLHPYAQFANVGSREITIEQLIEQERRLGFQPVEVENRDLGFTTANYWVKFELKNLTNRSLDYYLETARPVTDLVELYIVSSNGKIQKSISGDHIPFAQRSYPHRKNIFRINLPAGATERIYVNMTSDGEVICIPLMLRTSQNLLKVTSFEQFIFGIFYGMLIIAAIIYLFFFFGIKERTFIYYSLYVIFIGLLQFSLDGYFYQYFSPGGGWFSQKSVLFFATIAAFFLGRYSQVFLKIKFYDKILNRFFDVTYGLLAVLLLLLIFVPAALPLCYPLANILGLVILVLIIASVIRLYNKKAPVDPYFTVGILFLIIGFVIFILNNFGQIPTSFLSQNSSKFGTGLEVIFLSLSMANLIRKLKNEKEESNRLALVRSEEMNEMKSYFLSNISHELRTPLNAIMSLSNEISDNGDQKIRQDAQIIKYSAHSLLCSVNDILDFSKIEKGELKLEPTSFDPVRILGHISNNAAIKAKDQGLSFEFSTADNIPEMLIGDVERLGQIVNNVLNNAIKFTATGGIKFHVESENRPDNKTRLTLTIIDSGVGIAKEKMHNIFESFTQDNINNKRKYGGLGLGLYIVKALIEMQKGTIIMDSSPNQGTTCRIAIDYERMDSKQLPATASIDRVFDLNGKNILVVEDNAINQMVIKMITKKWLNTAVTYANNGQEGLDALRAGKFDIVLMDLQMPVMDGYEATIAIRKGETGEENKNIPIIAVTADVMESTKQTVIEIGMNHYLSKPIKNEILYEAVKNLL